MVKRRGPANELIARLQRLRVLTHQSLDFVHSSGATFPSIKTRQRSIIVVSLLSFFRFDELKNNIRRTSRKSWVEDDSGADPDFLAAGFSSTAQAPVCVVHYYAGMTYLSTVEMDSVEGLFCAAGNAGHTGTKVSVFFRERAYINESNTLLWAGRRGGAFSMPWKREYICAKSAAHMVRTHMGGN